MIAAPLPPPDYGGISSWSRIVNVKLGNRPDIELKFVDTAARYRAVTNQCLALRWVGGSAQALRDIWLVYRQLKIYCPNLLHLTTSAGPATLKDVLILRISKSLHVPSVIHYRMGRLPRIVARGGVEWKLTSWAMRLANAVIPLDSHSQSCIKTALPHINVVKLPNIVEIDHIDRITAQIPASPRPKSCTRLVFAGHVIPAKGLRELVSACARLADGSLLLEIIGPASPRFQKKLEKIASSTTKTDWLRFLGAMDHEETIQHIAQADLFVLPSYTEGMPNVVLEAMACGRTVLGTNVGAMPEMLDIGGPQQCGMCVPPRNVPALVDAIHRLISAPQLCRQMGLKARQRVEQLYSVPVGCGQLVDLWRSIIKPAPADSH